MTVALIDGMFYGEILIFCMIGISGMSVEMVLTR